MEGILWILFYVGIFYFMFRYGGCCGGMGHRNHEGHGESRDQRSLPGGPTASLTAPDPVCGMLVASSGGYGRVYGDHEYRFCSRSCLDQFEKDPEHYAFEERAAS
jgi:YHS domain-containing protein